MEDNSINQLLSSVEIISAIKPLFASQNPYLPVYSALGGAFVGAISSIIPNMILESIRYKKEAKALTLQVYSEIKSTVQIFEYRGYLEHVSEVIRNIENGEYTTDRFTIHFPDKRHTVFEAVLPKLGTIDIQLQIKFIAFYQSVESIIQDVKPGGYMNSQECNLKDFKDLLSLGRRVIKNGKDIMAEIENKYTIKQV